MKEMMKCSRRNRWKKSQIREEINAPAEIQSISTKPKNESPEQEKVIAVLEGKLLEGSTKWLKANDEDTLSILSLAQK